VAVGCAPGVGQGGWPGLIGGGGVGLSSERLFFNFVKAIWWELPLLVSVFVFAFIWFLEGWFLHFQGLFCDGVGCE
jgi:hypothetical protein